MKHHSKRAMNPDDGSHPRIVQLNAHMQAHVQVEKAMP